MVCPRCGKEVEDSETLCPFCMQEIDKNMEFNDYRKDGFVQIQPKEGVEKPEPVGVAPKYFKIAEFNIFVIAIVYILFVSLFTVFSLRFVQKTTVTYVEPYKIKNTGLSSEDETEPETEKNDVKSYSIKDLYGSWTFQGNEKQDDIPIPYYIFGDKGSVQQSFGSITVNGKYKDLSEKNDPKVYISIYQGISGVYNFRYYGNKTDGYKLELIDEATGGSMILVPAKAKSWQVKPPKKPMIDKELVGKWYTKDKQKAYILYSSGSFKRITGDMCTTGAWSVEAENTITVKYIRTALTERDIPYHKTNNKKTVIINGVEYFKS